MPTQSSGSAATSKASVLRERAAAIVLATIFFVLYYQIGLLLNRPTVDTTDNYLDADNYTWMRRIAWEDGYKLEMRAPHPYAYFIFRPIGWTARQILGDPFVAALGLNSMAGGLCVFLAWEVVHRETRNGFYGLLVAATLGLSTSHLWFGSVIETYIFSSASLLLFLVLLGARGGSWLPLVGNSLITFGITATNFAQHLAALLAARGRLWEVVRYAAVVGALAVLVSLVHAEIYPSSSLSLAPEGASAEREFTVALFEEPAWRALGRAGLMLRTMMLYTVIAPRPYVFTDEVGGTFPRFNFFRIAPGEYAYSSYEGPAQGLVILWAGTCLLAFVFYLRTVQRTGSPGIQGGLLLCLAFNFVLHLFYGYEPFLYSPDWAYALILFVALSFSAFAARRSMQAGLMGFVLLLAWNQWQFLALVVAAVRPYLQ